nr:T6SS effector amidase Tae4 family protein [Salmonella enterica]
MALLSGGMGGVGERGIKITNKSNIYYGKTIEPGAGNFKTFLEKKWGKADETIKLPTTIDDVSKRLNNKKGVYIMIPKNPHDFGATGHATLWIGNRVINDHYYISKHTYAVYFWELKE